MTQAVMRACLAAGAVAAVLAAPATVLAKEDAKAWGKTLVQAYDVPAETLVRFEQFDEKNKRAGKNPAGLLGDTERWAGKAFEAPTSQNPYTLVVRVKGVARADGDVSSRWQTAWGLPDGTARGSILPELVRQGAKAGETVELVGGSAPVSFKENRSIQPVAEFMAMNNLRLDSVRVEVWSGMRNSTWLQRFGALTPMFFGVVFLGVVLWMRRR